MVGLPPDQAIVTHENSNAMYMDSQDNTDSDTVIKSQTNGPNG